MGVLKCVVRYLRVLFTATIVLLVACLLVNARGYAQLENEKPDAFDLILQVERGSFTLNEAITGLQTFDLKTYEEEFYLPVGILADALKFYVELDAANGLAEGWYLDPENTYRINIKDKTYTVRGQDFPLEENDYILKDYGNGLGEIYLHVDVMNKIWPLRLIVDFRYLKLKINTPQKLPFELERDRELRRSRLLDNQTEQEERLTATGQRLIKNDYRWVSKPVLNLAQAINWSENTQQISSSLNVQGQSDFLKTSASYGLNLNYQDDKLQTPSHLRFTMERRSYGDDSMGVGPFRFRHIKAGDISFRTPDLINGTTQGRGVTLSSKPHHRQSNFDTVTLEGIADAGWEVELYRNGQLIDFGVVNELGEYLFEDVQLLYGGNDFRILLFGPQGQIEERRENYKISSALEKPGQTSYELALSDTQEFLFAIDDTRIKNKQGIAYNAYVKHGINEWLSAFATLSKVQTQEGPRSYATIGANFQAFKGLGSVELYNEMGGGQALDVSFASRLKGWRYNLDGAFYDSFESDQAAFDNNAVVFEGRATANRTFSLPFGSFGLQFRGDHENRKSGVATTRIESSQFLQWSGFRFNHEIDALFRDSIDNDISARFQASKRFNKHVHGRSELRYDVHPDSKLDDISLNLNYNKDRIRGSINLRRDLQESTHSVSLNTSYDFDQVTAGLSTSWSDNGGVTVQLRAQTSLAPYGPGGSYIARNRSYINSAGFGARLFKDNDLDGVYGPDDEMVLNGALLINGTGTEFSDEDGMISNPRTLSVGYNNIFYDDQSSENPFFVAGNDGYRALIRPGVYTELDFPIVESGAIDGTAYLENGDPVPGLRLELVKIPSDVDPADNLQRFAKDGEVAANTITSFDGFYTFEFVKPGTYVVRAAASQKVHVPPSFVSVSPEGLFAYGVDLILLEQAVGENSAGVGKVEHNESGVAQNVPSSSTPAEIKESRSAQNSAHGAESAASLPHGTVQPAPLSVDSGLSAVVINRVRNGEFSGRIRVALNLLVPADFSIQEDVRSSLAISDDGKTLWLRLQNVTWQAETEGTFGASSAIKRYRILKPDQDTDGVVMELQMKQPVWPAEEMIEFSNDKDDTYLVFDFVLQEPNK